MSGGLLGENYLPPGCQRHIQRQNHKVQCQPTPMQLHDYNQQPCAASALKLWGLLANAGRPRFSLTPCLAAARCARLSTRRFARFASTSGGGGSDSSLGFLGPKRRQPLVAVLVE